MNSPSKNNNKQTEQDIQNILDENLIEKNSADIQNHINKKYNSPFKIFKLSSKSRSLAFLVAIASLLSIISNAIYIISYLQGESNYSQVAKGCDIIAFTVYSLEFIIKLISEGRYYFCSWTNIINLLLLASFIVPFCITDYILELAYLSFFRVFQVTTFFSHIPFLAEIEIVHRTVLRNIISTFIMLILLVIAIFLFSIIAYFCFTSNPDSPLKNLGESFYFLTVEATGGGWTDFQAELDQVFSGARAFSILFIVFTYVIIVRGFVAFLADNSIVENRAFIKRREDKQKRIEEAENEIRPVEKIIEITSEMAKNNSNNENFDNIQFSEPIDIKISLAYDEKHIKSCRDFRNEVNKYNSWQFSSIQIKLEPKSRNEEPKIYFVQVIVSNRELKPKDFDNYKYGLNQFRTMKTIFSDFEKKKNEKSQGSLIDINDSTQNEGKEEMAKIKKILHDITTSKNTIKNGYKSNQGKDGIYVYDHALTNFDDTIKSFDPIQIQSTDFQTSTTDYPYYVYYRCVQKIKFENTSATMIVPSPLGDINITLKLNLLGKKRASDINENEADGLNIISGNDIKITEDKMLMKSGFWASSLATVLKDYSLHNRMINMCYHKIFQRTIMMWDYLPIPPELIKQENLKNDSDDDYDDFSDFVNQKQEPDY